MNRNWEEHMNNTVEIPRELFDQLLAYFNKSLWAISADEISENLNQDEPLRDALAQIADKLDG